MIAVDNGILLLLQVVLIGLAGFGLVDLVRRPAEGFPAAGKLTKPVWGAILGACLVVGLFAGGLGILGAVSAVASIVYLVDVRPALQGLRGPWY